MPERLTMNSSDLIALAREALTDPRRNGARIGSLSLPGNSLWESLLLVSVLSVLGLWLAALTGPSAAETTAMLPVPFALLALQLMAMLALALAVTLLGRMARGQGDFTGALRIVTWLQALLVVVQFVQVFLMLLLPPLAGFLSLAAIVGAAWVATGLVAGLHGFKSLPLTFLGIIGGIFAVAFVMSIFFTLFFPLLG